MINILNYGATTDFTYIYLPNGCNSYTSLLEEFNFMLDISGNNNTIIVSLANFAQTNINGNC